MTYLEFHFVFTVPAILVLAVLFVLRKSRWRSEGALKFLALLAVIAFVYTTAWDNYLVFKGIWWYGEDRVLGTIGYVPVEEYLFFLLQPILTGLWFYYLLSIVPPGSVGANEKLHRRIGGIVFLVMLAGGWLLMQVESGLYLGLIVIWAGPVLGGQWWYAGSWIWATRWHCVVGVGIPTVYLWIADRIAIGLGIWTIADEYTVGLDLFGLPLEEAIFFLVTNLLVVQGLIMFLHIGDPAGRFRVPDPTFRVVAS